MRPTPVLNNHMLQNRGKTPARALIGQNPTRPDMTESQLPVSKLVYFRSRSLNFINAVKSLNKPIMDIMLQI